MRASYLLLAMSFFVLPTLSSAGCASGRKAEKLHKRGEATLEAAAQKYNDHLRWGHTEKAIEFIAPPEREAFIAAQSKLAKVVRTIEVRVGTVDFPPGSKEATVTVTRTFYRNDDLLEQNETVLQVWHLEDGRWYVDWRGKPEG